MEPLRGNDIRQQNEKLVLNIIHKSSGISQSEVVQLTGLKPPTVFRIFSSLESEGLIEVYDKQVEESEKKGRRPVFYRVKADARYIVGIDFWVGLASIVVVDFAGNPIHESITEFPMPLDANQVVEELKRLTEGALGESGVEREKVIGIGIGAPGRVDIENGVVLYYGRIPGMKNFSIKEPMEDMFGLPVYVHNNAAVVALSEYRYGSAKEHEALLTVLIRTGVGGSFINRGNIFVTNNRTTLEIGHMLIDLGGRACGCGREGCLEPYVSEDAILSDLSVHVGEVDIERLDLLLHEGEPRTLKLLSEKAEILAEGMRTLFQLFGPDSFLIVTRSERLSSFLEEKVRDLLSCEPNGRSLDECAVLSCRYDPILAGIGAGDLVLDHFFS